MRRSGAVRARSRDHPVNPLLVFLMRFFRLLALALSASVGPVASAEIVVADGYSVASHSIAPGGALAGALDLLPNGDLVLFDGTSLVRVDPATGGAVQTLFTPGGLAFASFVAVDPTGTYVLFGESVNHAIWRVPLDGGAPSIVATVYWNYACAFRAPGKAVIAHGESSFQNTMLVELDVPTGALDTLAVIAGPSGPLAFDQAGDLYYGTNHPSYPAPPDGQSVLRFPAALVESSIGPSHLTELDSIVFATGITATSAFEFDAQGDLFVGDSINGKITEFGPNGAAKGTVGVEANGVSPSVGALVFVAGESDGAQFAPYQPEHGGTLFALSTDFATFNHLNRIRPRRSVASARPAGPISAGPFLFRVDDGPANGFGLLFVATQRLAPELAVPVGTTAFLVGFAPGSLFATAPIQLDASGGLSVVATHPGGAIHVTAQAALWDVQVGPVGTTNPLHLTFQ